MDKSIRLNINLPSLHAAVTGVSCAVADSRADPGRFSHVLLMSGAVGAFNGVLRAYEPCPAFDPPHPCWLPGALLLAALTAALAQGSKCNLLFSEQMVVVTAGGFRARLSVLQGAATDGSEWVFPTAKAWGAALATAVYTGVGALLPIVAGGGDLAVLPWAQGVHIAPTAVYAARNTLAGRYLLPGIKGWPAGGLTLPTAMVAEMQRRGVPPQALVAALGADAAPTACTAHYVGAPGACVTSALLPGPWPGSVEALFNPAPPLKAKEYVAVPEMLLAAVTGLCPFAPSGVPAVIRFDPQGLTVQGAQGEELASYSLPGVGPCQGGFRADVLQYALPLATRIALRYPRAYWDGGQKSPLSGVFIGTNA